MVANGKVVPVIVGDTGPSYKIGEGSTALLRALSTNNGPRTFGSGVDYILFPGTRDPVDNLSADSLSGVIQAKGHALYAELLAQ